MTGRGPLRTAIEALPLRLQTLERDGDWVRDVLEPGRPPRVYRVRIFRRASSTFRSTCQDGNVAVNNFWPALLTPACSSHKLLTVR